MRYPVLKTHIEIIFLWQLTINTVMSCIKTEPHWGWVTSLLGSLRSESLCMVVNLGHCPNPDQWPALDSLALPAGLSPITHPLPQQNLCLEYPHVINWEVNPIKPKSIVNVNFNVFWPDISSCVSHETGIWIKGCLCVSFKDGYRKYHSFRRSLQYTLSCFYTF